ncbi:MAG TPA: cysteine desulfurase [Sediminispirochaeta sp.]|nr:cysteine desulfurase [Sediminispirochaeta sp.]
MKQTYLDWAATTPIDREIAETMLRDQLDYPGNPSSRHALGYQARDYLEEARAHTAALLGFPKPEPSHKARLVFTGGGTESNSIPLLAQLRKKRRGRLLISAIEHASVYELAPVFRDLGYEVRELKPDSSGRVDPRTVAAELNEETIAVALMLVNNETGAIQDIAATAALIRDYEKKIGRHIHFHCDAVQALGKIPLNYPSLSVDSMAFSAHKIRGPRGVGLLWCSGDLVSLSSGGGQEAGLRPGTENIAGAWAMVHGMEKSLTSLEENFKHAAGLRDHFYEAIDEIPGVTPFPEERRELQEFFSPYILAVSIAPVPGEVMARVLDDRGFAVGTGSACSSGQKKKAGRVARAMGAPEETAQSLLRVSTGPGTSFEELDRFLDTFRQELKFLQHTVRRR